MSEAGFIADAPPIRRSAAQPPLDVWLRALLLLLFVAALGGLLAQFRTPMPHTVDSQLYAKQFASLDRQVADARALGKRPFTIVFLGTSRIRNVTLDPAAIAASARTAGVNRPVASTVIGINWGGFERLATALPMIEQRRPDLVVIMPELLTEDFAPLTRAKMAHGWLQSTLWGKPFSPFEIGETTKTYCVGFDQSPAERDAQFRVFMQTAPASRGPRQAVDFVRKLARSGIGVLITDVPVAPELAALRPALPSEDSFERSLGLEAEPAIDTQFTGSIWPRQHYCDFAHLDPVRGEVWRRGLFAIVRHKNGGML